MNGIKYRFADEMKDSGIEWIGKIPREWTTKRIKTIGEVKNGATPQSTNEMYWDGNIEWFTPTDMVYLDLLSSKRKLTKRGLMSCGTQLVSKDSILISCRAPIGKLGIIRSVLSTFNQGCKSITVRSEDYKYSYYCIASSVDQLVALGKGTTFMELSGPDLSNFKIPCPDILVQRKIANFLDIKTAQFDSIIAKKEQLIAKLEEAKKSLISEVVTGKVKIVDGKLVPRQPEEMKDSGVEWLGMIPKEWKHSKVKFELDFYDNKRIPLSSEERGKISDKIYDYYGASGVIDQVDNYIFNGTYILVGEDGANLYSRSSPLAFLAMGKFWVNNHAHILKSKNDQDKFYVHLLESIDYFNNITGSAQPKLTQENLGSIVIFVPKYEEQNYISSFLDTKLEELNKVVISIENQINAIKSAKQSLISEAVTGKIDLRDWEIIEQGGAS